MNLPQPSVHIYVITIKVLQLRASDSVDGQREHTSLFTEVEWSHLPFIADKLKVCSALLLSNIHSQSILFRFTGTQECTALLLCGQLCNDCMVFCNCHAVFGTTDLRKGLFSSLFSSPLAACRSSLFVGTLRHN